MILAAALDISTKEVIGVAPREIWEMLRERHSTRAITICDARQLLTVIRALFFLACTAGEAHITFWKEWTSSIITAQDVIAALAKHKADQDQETIPETLADEAIDQEFRVCSIGSSESEIDIFKSHE
ncbi:unnamed protein product [Strongylus vulgaris]|uniref:Uncharacterized protein n=1 Tax=Strongylus vulgaris TaxID=40348 RepID=A0A3P7L065_STRVU|nr:unnamed protein product [Strongylus vulgaris]